MQTSDLLKFIKNYPAVVAGVLIIIGSILYKFVLTTAPDFEAETFAAQRELRTINANLRHAVSLEDDLQALQNLADRIAPKLMDREREILNLGYFYELERRTGARVMRAEQRPTEEAFTSATGLAALKNFLPIPFDLVLEGSHQEVAAYLYHLRTDRYWTRLHTMDFTLTQQGGVLSGEPRVEMRLFILGSLPPAPPPPAKKAS